MDEIFSEVCREGLSGAKACKSCRSRQKLSNEYFEQLIFLQNLASTQNRTSPVKFDHLAEKSDKDSISNRRLWFFSQMIKLCRARSLLYRRQMLQENIRWKALDEIYKIYMLLHRSDLNILEFFRQFFSHFLAKFCKI